MSVRHSKESVFKITMCPQIQLSMKLDDDDLEAGDDADTDNNHPLSSGSKKRKLWKQHYVIEAEQVGESAGTMGCTHMISATNCSTSRARSLATSISTQVRQETHDTCIKFGFFITFGLGYVRRAFLSKLNLVKRFLYFAILLTFINFISSILFSFHPVTTYSILHKKAIPIPMILSIMYNYFV